MAKYEPHDRFYRKARERGLPSRAAFKIEELLARFQLVRPGARVVDLGECRMRDPDQTLARSWMLVLERLLPCVTLPLPPRGVSPGYPDSLGNRGIPSIHIRTGRCATADQQRAGSDRRPSHVFCRDNSGRVG